MLHTRKLDMKMSGDTLETGGVNELVVVDTYRKKGEVGTRIGKRDSTQKASHTQVDRSNTLRAIFIMNVRYSESYRECICVGVGVMKD